jgi:hypothetical protein
MGPMSDVPSLKQYLAASVCQAMALHEMWLVKKVWHFSTQSEPKSGLCVVMTTHLMLSKHFKRFIWVQ